MVRYLVVVGALLLALAGSVGTASAQDVALPSATGLAWDHDGLNVDAFYLVVDDVEQTVAIAADARQVPFPALTPGVHTLSIVAGNATARSPRSNVLTVRVLVVPVSPTNFRIIVLP